MTEFHEFEYTVTKKPEGAYLTKRILMIALYVLFGLVYFFGLAAAHLYPLMALIIFFEWMLVFVTWKYVSIEYTYSLISGTMTFCICSKFHNDSFPSSIAFFSFSEQSNMSTNKQINKLLFFITLSSYPNTDIHHCTPPPDCPNNGAAFPASTVVPFGSKKEDVLVIVLPVGNDNKFRALEP